MTFLIHLESPLGGICDAMRFIRHQKCVCTFAGSSQVRVRHSAELLELIQFQRANLIYCHCFQATSLFSVPRSLARVQL